MERITNKNRLFYIKTKRINEKNKKIKLQNAVP